MRYLSADQVVAMHDVLLERWGGEPGGGHRGGAYEGAEAAVQAVRNSYYERVEELAAAYAVYIVQGHVFLDGNKRTGAAAVTTFCVLNGRTPRIEPDELFQAMIELQERAVNGESTERLVAWLAGHL
ncbi:MAG: type II toxin-antitoxin system death-on-curing family toxin [Myxococcota bacterium]